MSVIVKAHDLIATSTSAPFVVDGARTVAEAVGLLRLPLRGAVMILVNDRLAGWETVLQDGDAVELLPAVGGG